MNREDVIRWAREAGFATDAFVPDLEHFAALVAAAERKEMAEHCAEITRMAVEKAVAGAVEMEREACAKVCEDEDVAPTDDAVGVQWCIAKAIRARKDNA